MNFEDEFTESTSAKKPETPAQYVKLDDTELVKRDLDIFPDCYQHGTFQYLHALIRQHDSNKSASEFVGMIHPNPSPDIFNLFTLFWIFRLNYYLRGI